MNNSVKDVIIVGGGVIGMLTARFLHNAGLEVMLVDQGELGRESTWAGGGILSPLYPWRYGETFSSLTKQSLQHYPALCEALLAESGIDPQFIRSGLLFTGDAELAQAQTWAEQWGYELQHLTSTEALQNCEPQLADHFSSGLFLPDVPQVRNPRLAHALRTYLRLRPITLAEHTPVNGLISDNGRIKGVQLGNDVYYAKQVVVACGAWSSLFPEIKAAQVDTRPVLGQMIVVRGPRRWLNRILMHEGHYLIPREDGRILCGSTLEMNGFYKRTTDDVQAELYEAACHMMPALRGLPVMNHWSGLRPGSPNGVPYIGQHPEIEGLFVNAGHYRYGVTMGLASVQMLTDIMLGNTPVIDPAPYALTAERTPTADWV